MSVIGLVPASGATDLAFPQPHLLFVASDQLPPLSLHELHVRNVRTRDTDIEQLFSIESQVVSGEDNGATIIEMGTSSTFGAGHTDVHEWPRS